MPKSADPFAHHPGLRGKIADPMASFFREITVERLFEKYPQTRKYSDWFHPDARREALRHAALDGHEGDLWVFAYGSLMWDPALLFDELRRARVEGYSRQMILLDWRGGRGTETAPGLMAALAEGGECEGLAFRIPAALVDTETMILFRREMIAPGYHARFVIADLDDGPVRALTFVADHDQPEIRGDLGRDQQIAYIATGAGFLGTSRDYLANIVDHFETLGIHDPDCETLLREVDARRAGAG